MKTKDILTLLLILTLIFALGGCSSRKIESTNVVTSNGSVMANITFKGDSIDLDGYGATVDGNSVTITSGGIYSVSGMLKDGQIRVDTQDQQAVELILNGVDITCSTGAPIYILNAEKTVLTLADGTENHVEDGAAYVFENTEMDEPNAAILSNDDLTIGGIGSLTVKANYSNGIQSKDALKITGGDITVTAKNNGIKGRNNISVKEGNIVVSAGGDGLQSNNDEDLEKGFVNIEGGNLDIVAETDGIQAETSIFISGGHITISTGGGSINSNSDIGKPGNTWDNWGTGNASNGSSVASAKGLKAGVDITIAGGTIDIDSSDDSLNSNNGIRISSGDISLTSGDDGIHANAAIEINGGEVDITKCYEGIESAAITINEGDIYIVSSDDGFNVQGGNDGSAFMGRPGQGDLIASGSNYLDINGGYIVVNTLGDGLDVNGSINMTSGIVIVNGPTANDNGALDHINFTMTGGFLVAVGSSGMPQAPSTSSTQYAVMLNLESLQPANTMIRIETTEGKEILTFVPIKAYQSVVLSSPELEKDSTYVVYMGGSSSGTVTDGLYTGGEYTTGTQNTSFTISGMVTTIGTAVGFRGGRGGMPPGGSW